MDNKKIKFYEIGQKVGKLTILEDVSIKGDVRGTIFKCRCECGREKNIKQSNLKRGTWNCGCSNKGWTYRDLTGSVFYRLTVKRRFGTDQRGEVLWECQCSCDERNIVIVLGSNLRTGNSQSCGCLKKENIIAWTSRTGEDHYNWKGGAQFADCETYFDKLNPYDLIRKGIEFPEFIEAECTYCGKYFYPTRRQVMSRIAAIEQRKEDRYGEHRFYCEDPYCKINCSIYGQKKYPKGYKKATSREVSPELRKEVLKRDNWTCQRCGVTENLHCHHMRGAVIESIFANDPFWCITLCKSCHKLAHKETGCKYTDLQCKEKESYANFI